MSKWTAVHPQGKERHFLVTRLIRDEDDVIIACELEAVISKNSYEMDWRKLKDDKYRKTGWARD